MATTGTKRTILVLHGYSQNATVFSKRLGALRKQCAKTVDFVFIDGPIILQPADLPQVTLEALGTSSEAIEMNESRGWWKWNGNRSEAIGLPESLEVLRDVLKTRKFDGVLGFSQGAAMGALLSALLERPHTYPPFLVDGNTPHPPFQFCVAVSGFRPSGSIADAIFQTAYATPTLHILGRTDVIVVEERSRKLIDISTNARVEEHDGGHFVPSKGNWRKFLAAYLLDPTDNVPSPSLFPTAENSGTATPIDEPSTQVNKL
ncbi:FSH1-domain-containing protein [Mycena maculata]|uniref:FSH1-domain-containing protein n=1 Tax=Mycena maculata TaxID=230809 RepID=A0AAD7K412_9AGAR|nr:FSH1-domain-containing protein [Mycena maculata]